MLNTLKGCSIRQSRMPDKTERSSDFRQDRAGHADTLNWPTVAPPWWESFTPPLPSSIPRLKVGGRMYAAALTVVSAQPAAPCGLDLDG